MKDSLPIVPNQHLYSVGPLSTIAPSTISVGITSTSQSFLSLCLHQLNLQPITDNNNNSTNYIIIHYLPNQPKSHRVLKIASTHPSIIIIIVTSPFPFLFKPPFCSLSFLSPLSCPLLSLSLFFQPTLILPVYQMYMD